MGLDCNLHCGRSRLGKRGGARIQNALGRGLVAGLALGIGGASRADDLSTTPANPPPAVVYQNDRKPNVPWSIHVVRVPRSQTAFELHSAHAGGSAVGLTTLSDQVDDVGSSLGTVVAAINGDFYHRNGAMAGDPRGLQIVEGELISAPNGGVSVWIDAADEPHLGNSTSLLQVTWPNGMNTPIGLNGERAYNEIELYTPAVGRSTRTAGGRDLILEQSGNSPWLPLRPGRVYRARVRDVLDGRNSPITAATMVLSIGPGLIRRVPPIQIGNELIISTATMPSLRGVKTAISGGPILVRGGRMERLRNTDSESYQFSSMTERHPRSAMGWNDDWYFLVEVDGRQRPLSVGMTLYELSAYLISLGCREAINFDGGGSATLWYDGFVRNRPCDGRERRIANSLLVVKKNSDSRARGSDAAAKVEKP